MIVIFAGDVEKDLFDDMKKCEGEGEGVLRVARVRNRGVLLKINGGVEILSAIWWGKLDMIIGDL